MKPFKKLHNILSNQQVVFWTFLVVFILPNVLMFFTESTSLFTRIINIVLPLSLFWIALTLKNKPGKMLFWLFIFIFFNALQIGLLYLYGESPIAVDMFLNMFTSNPSEAQELIVNLLPAIFMVAVVYIGAIILAIYSWHNKNTLSPLFRTVQRKYGLCLLGASVIMTGINYVADRTFRIQDDIYPINASYNLALAVKRAAKSVNYKKSCSEFTYNARATRGDSIPEIYILVIGETSRADNYGIYGYERNTTPRLATLDSTLAVYRDAITVSNTTYKSVPMILTPVCVEDYDSIYSRKGVFTAFKEAGYNTAFYSNQRRNHSLLDVMGQEADEVKFIKDGLSLTASLPDMDLLKCLKEKLDSYNGGKLFIILHCYGSHFNYKDRYEKGTGPFTPDNVASAKKQSRPTLINAYDNTIVEADKLLGSIVDMLKEKEVPAAMMFLSDHGEDIFDDERCRFLHSSPQPTYFQLRVPLIVWTSQQYRESFPQMWQQLEQHTDIPVSTNLVTFHTLVHMSGIETPYLDSRYALSSEQYVQHKRIYINDHNEFCSLDSCGLKQLDIDQFKAHQLLFP